MAQLSPAALVAIAIVVIVIALLIGYFIGTRFGGRKSAAMREAREKHDGYKNDVREHFEQTSAIMSRMVEDYRDMYRHMAEGADKLADIHPERQITPPPAPEAITRDPDTKAEQAPAENGETESPAVSPAANDARTSRGGADATGSSAPSARAAHSADDAGKPSDARKTDDGTNASEQTGKRPADTAPQDADTAAAKSGAAPGDTENAERRQSSAADRKSDAATGAASDTSGPASDAQSSKSAADKENVKKPEPK